MADSEMCLEAARKAFPNNEELRVAYMLGFGDGYDKAIPQPSLPTDLDEAAEKYAKGEGLENALGGWEDMSDAFKAGAEWMAQQGETIFDTIDIDGQGQRWLTDNLLQGDYDCGEEVIVQIRKK